MRKFDLESETGGKMGLFTGLLVSLLLLTVLWSGCGGGGNDAEPQRSSEMVPSVVQDQSSTVDDQTSVPTSATDQAQTEAHLPSPPPSAVETEQPVPEGMSSPPEQTRSPVETDTAAPPASAPTPTRSSHASSGYLGPYCLQVGSFRKPSYAENRAGELEGAGYTVEIVEATVRGDVYYRVYLPNLSSQYDAERLGERVQRDLGFDYLVKKIE